MNLTAGGADASSPAKRLFITHVDAFGPYLKVSGQLNPDAVNIVRNKVYQLLSTCYAIDPNLPILSQQALLLPGILGLYKCKIGAAPTDGEFMRARVCKVIQGMTVAMSNSLQVEVDFIDYGYSVLVSAYELLFPQHPEHLESIPPLCTQYIVLGICTEWKKSELDEVLRNIMHQTLDIHIQMEYLQYKFITMKWKEFNFSEFLIHQKKIGAPISNDLVRVSFLKLLKQQQQQLQHQFYAGGIANNNNNINIHNNNNNNDYFHNNAMNNNAATPTITSNATQTSPILYPAMGMGVAVAGGGAINFAAGANQVREQMSVRRSLAERLQQNQQLTMQGAAVTHVQPRMPHTIGNLRSMMQGIQIQNNHIPYTGQHYQHPQLQPLSMTPTAPFISSSMSVPSPTAQPNSYNARYQRPLAPPAQQVAKPSSPPHRVRSGTATFKSNNLTMSMFYDVFVSFVENGPCLFSVQLVNSQNELTEMMNRIERVKLQQFSEKPVLGTACIARYSEDGQLYRALITGVQPTACKVAYIDYGNAELVNFRDLYEIPEEFLDAKAFAIRFTLSGHKDLEPIDESLKKAFKDLVIYKKCKLHVMPLEGPPLVQYCELFLEGKNILDVLKEIQKCRLVYAKAEPLQNNDIVEIRYIDSPKHFYVQKVSNIEEFEQLMDDMFLYYNKNQVVPNHLALGSPCIVKYDNEWYRAEVMRADATAIAVRHVDFGYEQMVTKNLLSTIAEKHLQLPRQAVQCCLKGFENNELCKDLATTQFEMLAEESNRRRRSFTVKVFRIQPDGVNLVNLCTKELNVMKKLYKLSMPFDKYLSLEKDDFNMHPDTYHQNGCAKSEHINNNGAAERGSSAAPPRKAASSITSSTDVYAVQSSGKKGGANILNPTALNSDVKKQPFNGKPIQQQKRQSGSGSNSASTEWDKQSSASSSVDNRESRSSSSEYKQENKRGQQRQRNQEKLNVSVTSSDRRSNGSSGSGGYNKQRGGPPTSNIPPRFQRQQQDNENRRQQNESQKQQQRSGQQRSQNAPQGFSQQRQKLTSGRSSKQSSADDAQSNHSEQQSTSDVMYLPFDRAFPHEHIETPAREDITICWWISPHQFYTHLKSRIPEFEHLMSRMKEFYKNKSHQQLQLKVGSYVVARFRKDNSVYRARILACNQMLRKYKVLFVDFGSQYTVSSEDIWQVEKRFADFPCMAYLCAFHDIISNVDHLQIIDLMEKYLPAGSKLTCEYIERVDEEGDLYYVNVNVNNMSLRETLKLDGLITQVCPEFRLELLPGQQIRAKISSIKDMLNFKIQIEGCDEEIKLLCSYNDVRYVKSNPDVAQKFKQFYEGVSCIVNITDITDNKVILLRPMLPLLKEDIPSYICTYPIILESFEARVIYIDSSYRLYVHMLSTELNISTLLNEMYNFYQKRGTDLNSFEPNTICAAHSSDDNWYRARITTRSRGSKEQIEVTYIDYGNSEKLEKSQLKQLDDKFYINKSAYAIEINLPINKNKSPALENVDNEENVLLNELKTLAENQTVTVKAIEMRNNRLIADLYKEDYSLVNVLIAKHLIRSKDVDAMRKLLDKEKPNIYEYIETVDLTLEDEDDFQSHNKNETSTNIKSPKSNSSGSPKQKKPTKEVLVGKEKKPKETDQQVINNQSKEESPIKPEIVAASTPATLFALSPSSELSTVVYAKSVASKPPTPEPTTGLESESEILADPYADMEHAVLSHCDNPTRFFVHPQHKLDELRRLQENLQIVASSLPPLMNVINGAHCISHYSVDKQWYRAKIMDAELMVLQFIDYGNTDALTDTTDIKEMSVFPDIEPLCLPCALPIKPNSTADWVDAANGIFNDSYQKVLNYEYITRGDYERKSFIRLFIDGVDVADKLVMDGFAKPLQIVQSGENCYISHVNCLSDFYIQYEKDSKALELIEIYLSNNEKLQKVTKFEPNKIVAALFPDDEMWYRAKLLHELPSSKGFEVLFIDYGNTSISPECREISQDIAALPALSKKCALELPAHCKYWSEQAEEKFEVSALGETIFTVELREPAADHSVVKLLIDGRDITEDLSPLCEHKENAQLLQSDIMNASFSTSALHTSICEGSGLTMDAIISHANSPTDFYIQFKKDTIRLEDMTFSLNSLGMEPIQQPMLGQLCAAVFEEDGALYRARILDLSNPESKEYRVLFIDFGNEAISTDLRSLPQDLLQLKPFARHCQLESVTTGVEALSAKTFAVLIDECQGLVKVEILESAKSSSNQPDVVRLFAANTDENLGEKLNKLLGESAISANNTKNTCIVSHVVSPRHFYVQLKANSANMELIAKTLQKENVEKTMSLLKLADVEHVCSVYSADDDCYYRGRVDQVLASDTGYVVFLLDYGYVINATELRELSEDLRAIPALAVKCQLNELPVSASDAVIEEHFSALMEAHFGEIFEIEDDKVDPETRLHTVKLRTATYKDLAEELIHAVEGGTTHVEILSAVPTLHNCSVIHVNSPASFYIQLFGDVGAVEQITDVLLDAETDFEPFADLTVGAVCAAQFPDDLAYYRARILRVLDAEVGQCEVHYLDFGNNSVTEQFRQLPPDMLQMPGYSKHCALEKCSEMGFNNTEAITHFQALIDSRFSETFQVELLNTAVDPILCRLFYQDKNVATELQQLLKGAIGENETSSLCQSTLKQNEADIINHPSGGVGSMEGGDEAMPA